MSTGRMLGSGFVAALAGGLSVYALTKKPETTPTSSKLEPKMSFNEITSRIKLMENSVNVGGWPVVRIDTNQLPSNDPMEDFFDISKDGNGSRYFFGVFDGHGGWECATLLKQYLASYVAVEVDKVVGQTTSENLEFPELKKRRQLIDQALTKAFERMDQDLLTGAVVLPDFDPKGSVKHQSRSAFAGACAIFALIDGKDLYVACVGDSRAVVGRQLLDNRFVAIPMSQDQTTKNPDELRRLLQEHAGEEYTVVTRGRVLGSLMPTRAFGDARYKYPLGVHKPLVAVCHPRGGPKNYQTPPYVTATPVISHRQLDQHDKFLILATDGLWDTMSSEEAVEMTGDLTIDPIASLDKRLPSLAAPQYYARHDNNAATHLIRNALGGSDEWHVAELLSIEAPYSRRHRDDITIAVAFLDVNGKVQNGQGLETVKVEEGKPRGKGLLSEWVKQAKAERIAMDLERQQLSEQEPSRPGDVVGG